MIVLKILLIIILIIVVLLHFSVVVKVKGGTRTKKVGFTVKYMFFTLYPRKPKKPKKKRKSKKEEKEERETEQLLEEIENEVENEIENEVENEVENETEAVEVSVQAQKDEGREDKEEAPQETAQDNKPKPPKPEAAEESETSDVDLEEKSGEEPETKPDDTSDGKKGGLKDKLQGLKEKWDFIKPYIPIGWRSFKKLLKAIRIEGVKINIDTAKEDAYESAMFYGKLQAALFNILALLGRIFTLKVEEANVNCYFNEKRLDAEGEVTVKVRPSTMIHIGFCMAMKALTVLIPRLWRRHKKKKQAKKAAEKAKKAVTENKENNGENAA